MVPGEVAARLAASAEAVRAAVAGLLPAEAAWKPAPSRWSVLEVISHLRDEEREDFRPRLERTLRDPAEPWPPIDPEGWAVSRAYNAGSLERALGEFLEERERSLAWLGSLNSPDWDATHAHKAGSIRAGDLAAAWVAHDLLHLRQLARLRWESWRAAAAPYSPDYAGPAP